MENRGLVDVSGYGDTYTVYHDTGGRQLTMLQVLDVKTFQSLWPKMQPIDRYHTYGVARYCSIGYVECDTRIRNNKVSRSIQLTYNTSVTEQMIAGGIAHFIDPRVPWFERRLTYKRRRGWSFPHKPYCNVWRERKREYERMAAAEASCRGGDPDDYWDGYDDGGYDDE